jgi:hypothetical protein
MKRKFYQTSTRILPSGYFGCAAQRSNKIQKQESSMLDPGYSPGVADFYGMLKIFGGFAPKKIKENYDCVIMQWNIMALTWSTKIKSRRLMNVIILCQIVL